MVIYSAEGVPIISVKVDDSSYKYEEIMGDCNVYLEFSLTEHIEIEPGAYIYFNGVRYEMLRRENVSIQHSRNYEYKATFSGPQARFERYIMYNYQDGRVKFDMIAKPDTLLTMVLWNLNQREPNTWSMGSYIVKDERLVSFNHTNIKDALNIIAEAFDTEWSVEPYGAGFRINLRKNEFNKESPLALGYGKNQGFKPGVGRLSYGEFGQVEKVWIDGSDRNISLQNYGWTTVHFPRSFSFKIDAQGKYRYYVGQVLYQQDGYDGATALDFITDEFGASVRLASAASSCVEASLDLTEYYPKRVGTVTDVYYFYKGQYLHYSDLAELQDVDWSEVQVDIIDDTIGEGADSLDYDECKFSNDEPLTVIFQNGMLAGREFNATFIKEPLMRSVVDPNTGQVVIDPTTGEPVKEVARPGNRFELSRATIDGVDMPNAAFRPNAATGGAQDSYIVVNCWLPAKYIRDDVNGAGAELDSLRAACKFIRENKDPQFSFKGTVDDLYSHRNWNEIHDKFIVGGCISFQNDSIQPEPIVTRIIGIKTFVNNPYAPELTLSNETVKGGMSSKIAKLSGDDEHIIEAVKKARRYSQRSFRDAKETIAMLAGAIDYFSEGINPITVETMSLLVGYEALQFRFWTTRACNTNADPVYHYDPDARIFTLDACVIQHLTLGIKEITSSKNVQGNPVRQYTDYLRWSMAQVDFGQSYFIGTDPNTGKSLADTAYYLYAKVDSANVAKADSEMSVEELTHIYGSFVLTTQKRVMKQKLEAVHEQDGDYYYLLVGILNSEYEGGRSFAPLFGFTEVLPGQITTDVLRSASGDSFFDLVNNQFQLGNSLSFVNNELVLNGAFVQSGDSRYRMVAFRGQWTAGETYYPNDEVWWQAPDGTISTYVYIFGTPSVATASNNPSNTTYWQAVALGIKGESPVTADLTNEADGFAVGSNGILDIQLTLSTGVKIRVGETEQTITSITPSVPSAFSSKIHLTPNTTTGAIAVVIDANTDFNSVRQVDIPIDVACAAGTRTVTYSLVPVKEGEDGAVYKLVPDTDVVKGTLQNNQTVYIPSTVSVAKMAREGSGEMQTANFGYIFYSTDGGTTLQEYTSAVSASSGASAGRIIFYWYLNQNKTVLLDRETVPIVLDGSVGARGVSTAVVMLYKRSATAPTIDWNNALTYSFVTHQLTSNAPSGWYKKIADIPASDDPLYVTAATAASTGDTDDIAANEWADPVILAENGTDGLNTASVMLYKRASSTPSGTNAKPSGTARYTFATGVLSALSGTDMKDWQQTIPSGSNPCYVIQATAIATGAYDDIANSEWSSPVKLVENGAEGNGIDDIEEYYAFSPSGTTPPGTWPYDEEHRPSQQELLSHTGEYLWTKTVFSYTDPNKEDKVVVFAQYLPNNGSAGANGPMLVGRGKYDCDETGKEMTSGHQTYYGDDKIRNVVWYDNGSTARWYMTLDVREATGGNNYFSGIAPDDVGGDSYWAPFDGSFANVATGLLFARKAYLENAIVRFLETADAGSARIVAETNNLCMYDGVSDDPKLMITGNNLSVATNPVSFNFPLSQYASFQTNSYRGNASAIMRSSGISFNVAGDGAVLVIPDIQVDLNAGLNSYSGNGSGFVYMYLAWELTGPDGTDTWFGEGPYSGEFGRVGSYSNKQYTDRVTFEGGRIPISRGQYTLKLYCEMNAYGCGEGNTDLTFVANASPYTTYNNFTVGYPMEKTEIGANGFQVVYSATQLFKCVIDSNDVVNFRMQCDDVGIEVSSNGSGGTMWIRLGGQWYTASRNGSGYLVLTPDNNH